MTTAGDLAPILDAGLRRWLDGYLSLPGAMRGPAEPIGDEALRVALLSMTRAHAFSTRVLVGDRHHQFSARVFGPDVWIGCSWNTLPPTLSGAPVLAAIRTVLSLPQPTEAAEPEPASPPVTSPSEPPPRQLALF